MPPLHIDPRGVARCLRHRLLTAGALVGVATWAPEGHAQSPSAGATPGEAPARVEQLTVLGSRTGARTVLDSPAPIDLYGELDLQSTGAAGGELGEALANLAPSFSFPRQSNSVTSDHVRGARLRNLGPDQVLVLVNGQRGHPSAVVNDNTTFGRGTNAFDFNTVPMSAVQSVEILRDGASAQYGSDAVAGVINVVLRDEPEGGRVSASYGAHVTRPGVVLNRTEVDGNTLTVAGDYGVRAGTDGFLRGGVEVRRRGTTDRGGPNRVPAFVAPPTVNNLALRGTQTSRSGDSAMDGHRLWTNGRFRVADVEMRLHGTYHDEQTEGAVLFRHPDSNQNVADLYPAGTLPRTVGDNRDLGLSVGLSTRLGNWDLDTDAGLGRNRFGFGVADSLNPSLGAESPTRFFSGRFVTQQATLSVDGRRDVMAGGVELALAVGGAYRHEAFRSSPGEEASYVAGDFRFDRDVVLEDGPVVPLEALVGGPDIGAQGAKGVTPLDAADIDRHVYAAYVELSSHLTETVHLSLAGRVEDYSDFGSTATGRLSGLFELNDALALRGSVSTSFRAPTLSQIGWSRSDNTFDRETFERVSSRLVRADSAVGRALGVEPLREETSFNRSVGLTARITPSLHATVDVFRIDIDDRIALSEFLQGSALIDAVRGLPGGEGLQSVNFFTNAIDTRTDGLEATLGWRLPWGPGTLALDGSYMYARTVLRSIRPAPEPLLAIDPDASLFEEGARNVLTDASPRHQGVLGGTWSHARWRLSGRVRYYGTVTRDRGFAAQTFGADTLLDASVTRILSAGVELTVGADNLLDGYPDRTGESLDFGGNFPFEVITPAGSNGRYLYGRVDYRF